MDSKLFDDALLPVYQGITFHNQGEKQIFRYSENKQKIVSGVNYKKALELQTRGTANP